MWLFSTLHSTIPPPPPPRSQLVDLINYTADQDATSMAQSLVGYARQQQEDPNILIPYGVEARAAGQQWSGGKLDDTCCIVIKFA